MRKNNQNINSDLKVFYYLGADKSFLKTDSENSPEEGIFRGMKLGRKTSSII
jgi:hypothetical protein